MLEIHLVNGNTIDISIQGSAGLNRHIFPHPVVGVGTTGLNDYDLQGVGVGSARVCMLVMECI